MKTSVTDTSFDAYHAFSTASLGAQQQRIIEAVQARQEATIAEIARDLGWEKSTVSGRRNELIGARLVLGPKRRCSVTGRTVQTVRLKHFVC